MATHSFPKINQKEYLKKYLSGDKVKKKKKEKKHKKSSVKVKIIDDDINHLDTGLEIDEDLLLTGEDAPQIVGEYIEEIPANNKVPKWKSIVIKDEQEDETDTAKQNDTDLWGSKRGEVRVKQEIPFGQKRSYRTPDNSPPRRNERNRKFSSPPRRRRKSPSPLRKSPARKIKTEPQSPLYKKPDQNTQHSENESNNSFDSSPARRTHSDQSHTRRGKYLSKINEKQLSDPPLRRRNSPQSPLRKDERSSSRKTKNDSSYPLSRSRKDADQSPPRRDNDRDQSTPRQRQNVDYSPSPTKCLKRNDRNKSPFLSPNPRRRNSDQSPPRRNRLGKSDPRYRRDSDQSPPRKSKRRDSDQLSRRKIRNSSDDSPPRKNRSSSYRQGRQTPDDSPDRKGRKSPFQPLPSRKRKAQINLSPNRIKREQPTPDLSPQPRRSRWEKQESEKSVSPPPTHKPKPGKTLEGKKAGLQDAKSLQEENLKRRKQEDVLFEKMTTDVSGRNAEVQVRSTGRKGRRAREAVEEDPEERRRKEVHEEKKKLLYDRWGKGLKQLEDHKNRMLEQEYESSKPLARYSNDEDLEHHLKERERAEDPMLEYMRQKRKEKEKLSGKPQIPRYEGPYPENRFGIRPGYRWDGVDRSNGYEKKYFAVQNEKQARQDEAYKYSVEDM